MNNPQPSIKRLPYLVGPNPEILFHVYTSVLVSVATLLHRFVHGSPRPNPGKNQYKTLHALTTHIDFMNNQVQDLSALIGASNSVEKTIYPVGTHTLMLNASQMDRYTNLRNGALNAAPLMIRECSGLEGWRVTPVLLPLVEKELKVTQAAARGVFSMTNFGEAAIILRTGFISALYIFDLILHEEDPQLPGR